MPRFLPRRLQAATLENYVPRTPQQADALAAVRWWLDEVRAGRGPMLALIGKQGTGKSHLLYAAARELYRQHETRSGLVVRRWYRLAHELRYGAGDAEPIVGAQRARAALWQARIALIDEVRPTSGTDFDDTQLAQFACNAWDDMTPVLVTTNVHPLEAVMGPAAADRFTQIVIVGPSRQERAGGSR